MTHRLSHVLPALFLSLMAIPAMADVGPAFLPDLTFPQPVQQPDISTNGCIATQTTVCQ